MPPWFTKLLLIGVAGGLGALARYGLSGVVQNRLDGGFPWGTVAVNLVGCLAFGFLVAFLEGRFAFRSELRLFLLIGFMGAFTTFSTYVFETEQLLETGQWIWALGNLSLQNMVGLLALVAGITVGRIF